MVLNIEYGDCTMSRALNPRTAGPRLRSS